MIEECIADISGLKAISSESADRCASDMERMIDQVNSERGGQLA